jgi:hypothetical protein
MCRLLNLTQSAALGKYAVVKPSLHVCNPKIDEPEGCILQLINGIAMVDYKCRSGHTNSSCDDLPRAQLRLSSISDCRLTIDFSHS